MGLCLVHLVDVFLVLRIHAAQGLLHARQVLCQVLCH